MTDDQPSDAALQASHDMLLTLAAELYRERGDCEDDAVAHAHELLASEPAIPLPEWEELEVLEITPDADCVLDLIVAFEAAIAAIEPDRRETPAMLALTEAYQGMVNDLLARLDPPEPDDLAITRDAAYGFARPADPRDPS